MPERQVSCTAIRRLTSGIDSSTLCREQVLEVSEASRRQPSPSPLESASTHASECDAIPILLSDKCQTTQSNDEPPEGKGLRAVQRGRLLFEEKSPKPSEIHVGDGAEAARRRLGQMRIGLVNFTIETEFDRIACEIDPYQDRV
ncbi:MAG: hypothetical protein KVP17_001825 [Porospora cf. gigantea B]|uniref:uncharacterized protein n=1 Tax=Porospora cf. gigantea B TaxID=2853592 RepID=UPI003571DD6E|nr:MAG: hypothetical protein KVP17_001825 [Porospora cf. gigantea B]